MNGKRSQTLDYKTRLFVMLFSGDEVHDCIMRSSDSDDASKSVHKCAIFDYICAL